MNIKVIEAQKAPKTVPTIHIIKPEIVNYSKVKLYVPKVNGKPSVQPGKNWHVYFYYRNPETGKYDGKSKFVVKHNINRLKTVQERKAFGNNLVRVYTNLLHDGYNPYNKTKPDTETLQAPEMSLEKALLYALARKKRTGSESYSSDLEHRAKTFIKFAARQGFDQIDVNACTTRHIIIFLNQLEKKGLKPKTINNFRGNLSGLFSLLANDMIVNQNPVTIIKKRKENPQKNKPFTPGQVKKVKAWFLANDPEMIGYLKFIGYGFLRPIEIIRLQIENIHLDNNFLQVRSKTENLATVRIIPQLKEVLLKMDLQGARGKDYLFTRHGKPGSWVASEKTKTKAFSDRFKKMKDALGFDGFHGIYSLRHTFALDLYNSFTGQGYTGQEAELKMLPITRHKSLAGLRNYLRDVGAMMAKDYGGDYTIDF